MEYLLRFIQMHENFRQAETEAIAELQGLKIEWVYHSEDSPFAIIRFPNGEDTDRAARTLITRSILGSAIFELWGEGSDYDSLHEDVKRRSQHLWPPHNKSTFRFEIDAYQGSHTNERRTEIIESFRYMAFQGPIRMKNPDVQFTVFEEYALNVLTPHKLLLGKFVAESGRRAMSTYTLKKRSYIATTSMDAELSLVTANMALAAPGKLAYDPFMGTGSFPLSCAHFGSVVFGSDMDGRSIRGKKGRNVQGNFKQYGTESLYLGGYAADVTNSPLQSRRYLDSIVCDPPYGVREGLKVLGHIKERLKTEVIMANGVPAHLQDDYVPPKRPYSFLRMIDDILDFSALRLVDGGRLCMWMPVAGAVEDAEPELAEASEQETRDEPDAVEYETPSHPALQLVSECTQHFNKWSRRLLTYRRLPDARIDANELGSRIAARLALDEVDRTSSASDLNDFRKKYFAGFK